MDIRSDCYLQDTDMGRCLVDIRGDCYLRDTHGPRAWWTSGVTVTYGIHMGRCLVADKRGDCYLQDTDRISDDRLEPDN